jgi:hypothetical protein
MRRYLLYWRRKIRVTTVAATQAMVGVTQATVAAIRAMAAVGMVHHHLHRDQTQMDRY